MLGQHMKVSTFNDITYLLLIDKRRAVNNELQSINADSTCALNYNRKQ